MLNSFDMQLHPHADPVAQLRPDQTVQLSWRVQIIHLIISVSLSCDHVLKSWPDYQVILYKGKVRGMMRNGKP